MAATFSGLWDREDEAWLASPRQRIGAHLQFEDPRPRLGPAFAVEHRPGAGCGPQSAPLPTGVGIVDAAVHILAEEAQRVRDAKADELAINQGEQRFTAIGRGDRDVTQM
jgi:hypothetical protein